jgi:hypothetical protein
MVAGQYFCTRNDSVRHTRIRVLAYLAWRGPARGRSAAPPGRPPRGPWKEQKQDNTVFLSEKPKESEETRGGVVEVVMVLMTMTVMTRTRMMTKTTKTPIPRSCPLSPTPPALL